VEIRCEAALSQNADKSNDIRTARGAETFRRANSRMSLQEQIMASVVKGRWHRIPGVASPG
jgi:hypothetical protein